MIRNALMLAVAAIAVVALSAGGASARSNAVTLDRIGSDPFGADVPGAHATVVEPSAVAAGTTIVTAFQVGRNFGGGASAIGFATSTDAGRSWRSGLVPGVTTWTPSPGSHSRASDPVAAYDALRGRYLVAALAAPDLVVSSSPNGVAWRPPSTATSGFVDKEWLTCDGWRGSPFRGRCYLAYTRFDPPGVNLRLEVQTSVDGGVSWGPPVMIPIDNTLLALEDTLSAEPVVRPSGELIVLYFEGRRIRASRSSDGGATFAASDAVANLFWRVYSFAPERLRAPNIPSVAVDAAGTVYAAWSDCRFRPGCTANDIVLARSPAPGVWTEPERIPLEPLIGAKDFLLPAIAVQPETRGAGAHLALAHYSLSTHDCTGAGCQLSAGFATSLDAGRSWRPEAVGNPMQLDWLAPTNIGRMVGDYVAAVFVPGRAVGIFSLGAPGQGGTFDEAVYDASARLPLPPRNTLQPRVVGQARLARTLTCRPGAWSGTPPIAFAYRWLRGGRLIPGAAAAAFRPTRREAGALLACSVRATNPAGSAKATSRAVRVRR
jgi:hypothetical protein